MSDSYQPIYDAVRSRIGGVDVDRAVRDAIGGVDWNHLTGRILEEVASVRDEQIRPSVLYRPNVYTLGQGRWCALYGDNVQVGVCGFGATPAEACAEFDVAWRGGAL